MSLPRWDEEMKFELLRLKSELRPENFRVLHQPLGLGTMRVEALQTQASLFPHLGREAAKAEPWLGTQAMSPSERLNPPLTTNEPPASLLRAAKVQPSLAKAPRSSVARLTRAVLVHVLDLSFVCLSLSLGLILLSWVVDPGHMSFNLDTLKEAGPLQFLQKLQTLALVLGVYTSFVLYWIFFKVVSGSTLGETCFDLMKDTETRGTAAPINGSGDS